MASEHVNGGDWRHQSACLQAPDPDLWFPVGNSGPALAQIRAAKAVCQGCPVIAECREWALSVREAHGVWGGMSEDDRFVELRHRSRRQRTGSAPAAAGVAA